MKYRFLLSAVVLYVLALALVVAMTWPWAMHFDGQLIFHWDPPFHAWKLELMARRILSGDPFFLNRETTLLYPHAGTLYFEALQWPASLFAALLFGVTGRSPEFIYQVTLLVFWCLSAPCMFLLLRCLRLSRLASAAAALAFCILPYRISYVNEFQMQFAFVTPLFFAAALHFFRRPCFWRGALVAATLWLYAVTELNQAVFILFTLPFVAVSFLVADPGIVKSSGFRRGICGGAVTGLALVFVLLLPYAVQHSGGAVVRDLSEVDRHSVQVFSFLRPFGKFHLWNFNAKTEEWQAYPTIAVALLCLLWIGRMAKDSIRDKACPKWRRLAPFPMLLSAACFMALSAMFQCGVGTGNAVLVKLWSWLPVACGACALAGCFSAGGAAEERRLQWAFCGAGIFFAFLTVGPVLAINADGRTFAAGNVLYVALYKYGPFLKGFRAACRFGVFVHFFMLVGAAFALDAIVRRIGAKCASGIPPRLIVPIRAAAAGLFLAAVAIEAIPPEKLLRNVSVDCVDTCRVIQGLTRRREPFTLAVLPMGFRFIDGMTMFTILKDRFNSFYAWCGYVPPETEAVCASIKRGDFASACDELFTLWPECLFLVDAARPIAASGSYIEAFPSHVREVAGTMRVDYVSALAGEADIVDSDSRFTLLSIRRDKVASAFTKRFRTDYAIEMPFARFSLAASGVGVSSVTLNGNKLGALQVLPDGSYSVALPGKLLVSTGGNELRIELDGEAVLSAFSLETDVAGDMRE